ncbi:SH3 domain-containing protein [Actinokineospora iranica]|uniref:SH3 domain-containing protein n=1 Tax=Actinokineospora iranica TaxID=1271860 RepID=A0A1G6SKR9_9PSEU|nr:SH3 domain-containing protein [Actinokineospora iranica]SDD17469.1 hypothetical protein SAMN05216174_10840 [Actinokineospora iranica]
MLVPKRTMLVGAALVGVVVVYSMGVEPPGRDGSAPASSESKCRVEVTADVLNVRAAPDGKAEIVGKFKQGAEADAEVIVQNGFRMLGENRWASAEFLKPLPGRACD